MPSRTRIRLWPPSIASEITRSYAESPSCHVNQLSVHLKKQTTADVELVHQGVSNVALLARDILSRENWIVDDFIYNTALSMFDERRRALLHLVAVVAHALLDKQRTKDADVDLILSSWRRSLPGCDVHIILSGEWKNRRLATVCLPQLTGQRSSCDKVSQILSKPASIAKSVEIRAVLHRAVAFLRAPRRTNGVDSRSRRSSFRSGRRRCCFLWRGSRVAEPIARF